MKNIILCAVECQGAPCSKQAQYLKFLSDSNEIRTHNHLAHKRALSFTNLLIVEYCCCQLKSSDIAPVLSKEFLHIQATVECRLTLKWLGDIIIRYSQQLCFNLCICFISLFSVGIKSSAVRIKICAITTGVKKYKSIIKKKKENNNKVLLLWKSKLDTIEVLISMALTVFRMGFFGAAHGWEGGKTTPL